MLKVFRPFLLVTVGALGACGEQGARQSDAPVGETAVPSAPIQPTARLDASPAVATGPQVEREEAIETTFGEVLVTQLGIVDAAHAQAGWLDIEYPQSAGLGRFDRAVVMGSWGQMGEWEIDNRFSRYPVIVAHGGGSWQGHSCDWTSLTELQPSGPVELVRFLSDYSDAGADWGADSEIEEVSGQITQISQQGFKVRFSGTRTFTAEYRREGDALKLSSGDGTQLDGC